MGASMLSHAADRPARKDVNLVGEEDVEEPRRKSCET